MGSTLGAGQRAIGAAARERASREALREWWPSGRMGSRGLAMQESPRTAWAQGTTWLMAWRPLRGAIPLVRSCL